MLFTYKSTWRYHPEDLHRLDDVMSISNFCMTSMRCILLCSDDYCIIYNPGEVGPFRARTCRLSLYLLNGMLWRKLVPDMLFLVSNYMFWLEIVNPLYPEVHRVISCCNTCYFVTQASSSVRKGMFSRNFACLCSDLEGPCCFITCLLIIFPVSGLYFGRFAA
jgi:hypothetical protein